MGWIDSAVNAGLGLVLGEYNDKRQLRQQGKLGEQQLGLNKRQMDYGKQLDYEMWEKTNYAAQVEQMKKAGLNPGLAYGMSGGGGTTIGGGAGNVSAPSAPQGGGEIMGLQLMGAQKQLIEAQTRKTEAETTKTAGVDTELTGNQARIARLQANLLADSYESMYMKISSEADLIENQRRTEAARADVAESTVITDIMKKQGELIGLGLANELRKVETSLTQEQVNATVESVKQKWVELGISQDRLKLDQFVQDVANSTKLAVETVEKLVGTLTRGGRVVKKGKK